MNKNRCAFIGTFAHLFVPWQTLRSEARDEGRVPCDASLTPLSDTAGQWKGHAGGREGSGRENGFPTHSLSSPKVCTGPAEQCSG